MDEVTLSLGALIAFASIVANAVAMRESIKRNRERHDKRDQVDEEFKRALDQMAQRWRDLDTEARVRNEIKEDHTPVEGIPTREWRR